ncbi:hypothetical protein HSBAA_60320 [Vreelandella sulfidaeris]|uniref:Uncharacterized protein n=1 Tax=Vreelandella sulfidaeris TaxID=115553 RepID=A0A455UEK8_9GAMM|nr:hypothetical protein HSBAA_60320 [Halomonas sulfidaeris]
MIVDAIGIVLSAGIVTVIAGTQANVKLPYTAIGQIATSGKRGVEIGGLGIDIGVGEAIGVTLRSLAGLLQFGTKYQRLRKPAVIHGVVAVTL